MDVETARRRLEEMLAELDSSISTLRDEHAGDSGELTVIDQHPADYATDLQDADRESAVIEAMMAQREQVESALARIDAGTYGRCVDCGRPLPDERLEARPEAARCVEDQARVEREEAVS